MEILYSNIKRTKNVMLYIKGNERGGVTNIEVSIVSSRNILDREFLVG